MSLADKLIGTPLREKAGSDTARRYEFQTLWGLTLLFQHHSSGGEYAIVFEFHDDVALFDSPTEPLKVRFFQVKSKGTVGAWTLAALLKREKSANKGDPPKPSIIDKMFDNIRKFEPDVESVEFVSNEACRLNNSSDAFRFNECGVDDFEKIVSSIREVDSAATDAEAGLLGFRRTNLSLSDAQGHLKGKLHNFVVENIGEVSFNLDTLFKAIVEECRRKSACVGPFANLEQLVRDKAVTRSQVQEWLDAVEMERRAPPWGEIAGSLVNMPYLEQVQIRKEYETYRAAVLNVGDSATHRVRRVIRASLDEFSALSPASHALPDILEYAVCKCHSVANKYLTPFSNAKLKAMIIYEIHATS